MTTTDTSAGNKHHPDWTDEAADMIIEVTDGTRFKVHFQVMKVFSTYFRDMPDHAKALCGDPEKVVQLTAESKCFANLLKFVNTRHLPAEKFTWPELREIADLGARYRFDTLIDLIIGAACQLVSLENHAAFDMFVFASEHNKPHLARQAIRKFGYDQFGHTHDIMNINCQFFEPASARCAVALFMLPFHCRHNGRATVLATRRFVHFALLKT